MPACSTTLPAARTATVSQTRSTSARMCVEKNTVVRPRERRDHLEDLAAPDGVERARRLVEQQQARRVDERLGHAEPLLHAARVAADLGAHAGEAGELEQGVDALAPHCRRQAEETRRELQVLGGRHPLVEAGHVRQVADQGVDRVGVARDVVAEDGRGPGRGARQAGEDAQRGRLAGAVGPEEAEHRALGHDEVDAVQCARRLVDLGEAGDLDGGDTWGRRRSGRRLERRLRAAPPPRARTARRRPRRPAAARRRPRRHETRPPVRAPGRRPGR